MTNTALKVYHNYEISPCKRYGEPDSPGKFYFEVCEPEEADVWTLYGHLGGEGVEAIGDFSTREAAEQVYSRITGLQFSGSYQADSRLRAMHAAPELLLQLRLLIDHRETPPHALSERLRKLRIQEAREVHVRATALPASPAGIASPGEKSQLPPDPEGMNGRRADWAGLAIAAFMAATGTDLEDAMPDLLADLMHWSDRAGYDFDTALDRARDHYGAETLGVVP